MRFLSHGGPFLSGAIRSAIWKRGENNQVLASGCHIKVVPVAQRISMMAVDPKQPASTRSFSLSSAFKTPGSKGFEARVDGATLVDLIQMECMRATRHVVRVTSEGRSGFLFFDRGQVVHAVSGGRIGERAALWILRWKAGTFESANLPWPLRTTISASWQSLVMMAAQREDEEARDSIPDSSEVQLGEVLQITEVQNDVDAQGVVEMTEPSEENTEVNASTAVHSGILRAVRVAPDGEVLNSAGPVGDFVDLASYALRLCSLIGESLGLEGFVGIECTAEDKTFLSFWEDETVVALEAEVGADIDAYRKQAGI